MLHEAQEAAGPRQDEKSSHRAGPDVAGAAWQGSWGELSVLRGCFYPVFAGEGQDDCARFLLSDMNYLDFRGVFLINKSLFLSSERP